MALKNVVGTVARTGVSTALAAVRDPLGTASQAVGLVKHTADAGLDLVRGRLAEDSADAPVQETSAEKPAAEKPAAEKPAAEQAAPEKTEPEDPRDHIPGPDLAAFAPPAPEDLPEPIVIEAE